MYIVVFGWYIIFKLENYKRDMFDKRKLVIIVNILDRVNGNEVIILIMKILVLEKWIDKNLLMKWI